MKKLLLLSFIALALIGCRKRTCTHCEAKSEHASVSYGWCGKNRHENAKAFREQFNRDLFIINCWEE